MKVYLALRAVNDVFVTQVYGFAVDGTDYILSVDIDYSERTLVAEEQQAMEQIFDQYVMHNYLIYLSVEHTRNLLHYNSIHSLHYIVSHMLPSAGQL